MTQSAVVIVHIGFPHVKQMREHIKFTPLTPCPAHPNQGNDANEPCYDIIARHRGITFHFYSLANDATC